MKVQNRRNFLKVGAGSAGLLLFTGFSKALAETCGLTPRQAEGPFYPGESNFQNDNDLTQIAGRPRRAKGQVVFIQGRVLDANCQPIENANVEIWQACASGKYQNSRDPNPAPLDPDFKYWGETFSDREGKYWFKTIIPGAYPADTNWERPPHIHFKISRLGYQELITQMYFQGEALNDKDLILRNIPRAERGRVIVEFRPAPVGFEPGSLVGNFDITMERVG